MKQKTQGRLRKNGIRKGIIAWAFLMPAVILYFLSKYVPTFMGIFISFFKLDVVELPGEFVKFDNYIRAFNDPNFYNSLVNVLEFFLLGLVMTFWCPIILAILINEVKKGRTVFRLFYFIPAVTPGLATTVLWKYIWQPDYGLANWFVGLFGIPPQMWLNDPSLVKFCMTLPGLLVCGGMNMVIYLSALQNVSSDYYEAAMLEGAGIIKRIRHITIPAIMPIIKTMFLLSMIESFNQLDGPLIMTGGGPMRSTETIVLYSYNQATYNMDYSYAISISNIVFGIVFILTAIQTIMNSRKERE